MNLSIKVDIVLPDPASQEKPIVSAEEYRAFSNIMFPFNFSLSILGTITNSINIRVFLEQGVRGNSTNIGLFALSFFDLIACVISIPVFSCFLFNFAKDYVNANDCIAYTQAPATIFLILGQTSNWITVYISLERALCIAIPLKVKLFLRPKVSVFVIVAIFLFFFTAILVNMIEISIIYVFDPDLNATVALSVDTPWGKRYRDILVLLLTSVLNSLALLIVAINTVIIIYKLNQFKKWRNNNLKNSGSGGVSSSNKDTEAPKKGKAISSKDADLVKSVTTVTSIFLVCMSMNHIPTTVIHFMPGLTAQGVNYYLLHTLYTIRYSGGLINASLNFFFYLKVSSRYKEAFYVVFPRCSPEQKDVS